MGSGKPSGQIDAAKATGDKAAADLGHGADAGWLDGRVRDLYIADTRDAPSPRLAALMRKLDKHEAASAPPSTDAVDG